MHQLGRWFISSIECVIDLTECNDLRTTFMAYGIAIACYIIDRNSISSLII